jgi:hypothetical protein
LARDLSDMISLIFTERDGKPIGTPWLFCGLSRHVATDVVRMSPIW